MGAQVAAQQIPNEFNMITINTINTQPVYNDGTIKIKHHSSSLGPVAILQWKPTKGKN